MASTGTGPRTPLFALLGLLFAACLLCGNSAHGLLLPRSPSNPNAAFSSRRHQSPSGSTDSRANRRRASFLPPLEARRKRGSLDKLLNDAESDPKDRRESGNNFWTRVSGVSLPPEMSKKAWELELGGNKVTVAAFRIDSTPYALGYECPRCAFDLWRGTLLRGQGQPGPKGVGNQGIPKISCPLCGTTYNLEDGQAGEPMKREGISGWVGGLTLSATSERDAKKGAIVIPLKMEKDEVYLDLRQLASELPQSSSKGE